MFIFEPNLRALRDGELTHEEFIGHTWRELDEQESNSYRQQFWQALRDFYGSDDEQCKLYTVKDLSLAYKMFMLRCVDRITQDEMWTEIFLLPPFESKVMTQIKPLLLWFSGTE